jgi:hypothetical protein
MGADGATARSWGGDAKSHVGVLGISHNEIGVCGTACADPRQFFI